MSGEPIQVGFRRVRPQTDVDIPLPRYMSAHAAGMDLCAAVAEPVTLPPGGIELIPSGFAVAIPPGYEAQIRPRSGLAARHGIGLVNSPGTIDADYRGEIKLIVINFGQSAYTIARGERVAQMVINRISQARPILVTKLDDTERGSGGFGHTG